MGFTKSQQLAINAKGRTLLISAAAGSGKTTTLTQRIIQAITKDKADISRMLIVTFTRAAAGGLRTKLSKALSDAVAESPDDEHLQKQILQLASAKISTIDSFFTEPIRANFEKLALPASMRLADEAEILPLRESIMAEVLEQLFENCEGLSEGELREVGYRDLITDLAGIITVARDSSKLSPTLLAIYNKLNTVPAGIGLLLTHAARMEKAATEEFFMSDEGKMLRQDHIDTMRYVKSSFAQLVSEMDGDPDMEIVYPAFLQDLDAISALLDALENKDLGYSAVKDAFNNRPTISLPRKKQEASERRDECKKRRTDLKDKVKELNETHYCRDALYISTAFTVSAQILKAIHEILAAFERKYDAEKVKKGLCEFSDMPKFMLKLLLDENGKPTDYAKTLAQSFDEVYIDEYQDVNDIQHLIFKLIGGNHRFMVGDIKQSIYGFREAKPAIFADYRERFKLYIEDCPIPDGTDSGNIIFMAENFRCDKNVVDFVNIICSAVFNTFKESISFSEKQDNLVFSKPSDDASYICPKVVLNIIETPQEEEDIQEEQDGETTEGKKTADAEEKEFEKTNAGEEAAKNDEDALSSGNLADEAMVTANEIARLIKAEKNAKGDPLRGSDITVLVRSHAHTPPLIEAFDKLHIRYVLSSKTGLFDDRDMKLLIDLLSIVDNPRNDIPLCRLLSADCETLSPFFTFEELLKMRLLRKEQKERSLYDAILNYAEEKGNDELAARCKELEKEISKLRNLSSRLPADKFLRTVSTMERYRKLCQTEAFTYLYDCACRYVRQNWNGLYNFLKYLKQLQEKGESGKEPENGDLDSVTIMTIHQSKGLEFNTCFLFGTGKQFNMKDTKESLICSQEYGLSMKLHPLKEDSDDIIESMARRYEDTPLWQSGAIMLRQKQIEEEARILYVALTRAMERLYVSGTLPKSYAEELEKIAKTPDFHYAIKKSKTYLSWLLFALSKGSGEGIIYDRQIWKKGKITLTEPLSHSISFVEDESAALEQLTEMQKIPQEALTKDDFQKLQQLEYDSFMTREEKTYASLLQEDHRASEAEQRLSNIPAKVAASKISSKMLDEGIFIPIPRSRLAADNEEDPGEGESENEWRLRQRIALMTSQKTNFDSLLKATEESTAAEKGTAVHRFLQFCDYQNINTNGIEAEIKRLCDEKFISERTAGNLDKKKLAGFFESELYGKILDAANVHREFRFGLFRPAADFTEDEQLKASLQNKKIFVQGSIDLIIETQENEIILCDYKTDHVTFEEMHDPSLLAKRMKETHGDQLEQYQFAIQEIFGKSPSHIYIYSVPAGAAVEI